MGNKSKSKSNMWRLPKVSVGFALNLITVLMMAVAMPNTASAADISCGQCHGIKDNSIDVGTGDPVVTTRVIIPPESDTMPQVDNGIRGLHGVHMNYSSHTYGKTGTTSRGTCTYCHNNYYSHESGFVRFLYPNNRIVPNSRQPLLDNISGTNDGVIYKTLMIYTSADRGTSYEGNIPSLVFNPTGYCTKACHKGTSQTNQAPWGNYSTASVKLKCNACHADSSGKSGTETDLSGTHMAHLGNSASVPSGISLNSANNAGCVNCHTNNTSEGKTLIDNGTMVGGNGKAYPHASDGTNVVSDNVTLTGQITSSTKAGTNTTCANACHPRSNLITPAVKWGDSLNCNMCHYYETTPTSTGNNLVSTGSLPGAHNLHLDGGLTCANCHIVPGDTAHVTKMPPSSTGVTFVPGVSYSGGPNGTCSISCHPSTSSTWNTTVATLSCKGCHDQIINTNATDAALGATLRNISSDFANGSHHIVGSWATISPKDCAACHIEGDTNTGNTTSYHMNGTIDLKQWKTSFTTSGTMHNNYTSLPYTPSSANTALTPFCVGCHNDTNKAAKPFSDGNTPNVYAWDYNSIGSKYNNNGTTPWGKFDSASYNVVPADVVNKAYSPHGQAKKNNSVMSIATFSMYSSTSAVQCYDCHNSHGSTVASGTSYTSGNSQGGIIKTTSAYTPTARINGGTKNDYSSSSALCFDCHLGDNAAAPRMYTDYGLPLGKSIAGSYYDRVGNTKVWNNWSTSRWATSDVWRGSFAYKDANFAGGHFGNSLGYLQTNVATMGTKVNGNCTACHDPHGTASTIGTTKPVRTVAASGNTKVPTVSGTYSGTYTGVYVVQAVTATTYKVSGDGGVSWGGTVSIGSPATAITGITVTLPVAGATPYVADDTWTFIAGVATTPQYMVPSLKGTWIHSPYKEDRAPRSDYTTNKGPMTATTNRLGSIPRANDILGYNPTFGTQRLWDDNAGGTSAAGTSRLVGGPAPRSNPDFKTGSWVPGYNIPAVQGDGFGQGSLRSYGYSFTNITGMRGWNGYFIDDNTFGTSTLKPGGGSTVTPTPMTSANPAAVPGNFAGLCLQCHVWAKSSGGSLSNITSWTIKPTTGGGTYLPRLLTKPHETVSGMGTITINLFRRANYSANGTTWSNGNVSSSANAFPYGYMHNMPSYNAGTSHSAGQQQGPAGTVHLTSTYGTTDPTASTTGETDAHYYRWGVNPNQGTATTVDSGYHKFPCAKCHTPHVSRLPRLMKTNCLDNDDLTQAGATGGAHTTAAYATKTAVSSTSGDLMGALFRNVACHSTKIFGANESGNSWISGGGWNNKTPW